MNIPAAAAPAAARSPGFATFDRFIAAITGLPAAVLVAVETIILFAGVVSRYVFNAPLTWSDEPASILFLELAMLGSVIAAFPWISIGFL